MKQYLDLMRTVVEKGTDRRDRTGVGTRSIFGYQMRFDLLEGYDPHPHIPGAIAV
jgi:thymidylate synthase